MDYNAKGGKGVKLLLYALVSSNFFFIKMHIKYQYFIEPSLKQINNLHNSYYNNNV